MRSEMWIREPDSFKVEWLEGDTWFSLRFVSTAGHLDITVSGKELAERLATELAGGIDALLKHINNYQSPTNVQ